VRDAIRWGDGFMAVGFEGEAGDRAPQNAAIWLSADGLEWQRVEPRGDELSGIPLTYVVATGAGYVAWGFRGDALLTSPDGRHWTRRPLPAEIQIGPFGDGFVGWQRWRAAPSDPIWLSADAADWRQVEPSGLDAVLVTSLVDTRFGLFAVHALEPVHGNSASYRSANGLSWEPFFLPNGSAAYVIHSRPEAVYAGEGPCGPRNSTDCTGTLGWTPRLWRTTDGVTWELAPNDGYPDLGYFDGEFVVDLPGCDRNPFSECGQELRYGAAARVSSDGITWQTLTNYVGDELLLGDPRFGNFGAAVVGPAGVVAFSDYFEQRPAAWFARAVVRPPAPAVTFPPKPPATPEPHGDAACLGGEGGDPGVVCVPYELFIQLPAGARQVDCPPGAPTAPPAQYPGEVWIRLADDLYRMGTGECVGVPAP
jgi:hypothetical protein